MSVRLEPSIRATFIHRLVPETAGTITRRFSTRPLADAGAFAQGRVYWFDPIERRMTQPDGSYTAATARIELSDEDGYFRGLMAGPTTRYVTGSEMTVELLSEAGRAAGGTWRPLIRGRVTDIQCPPGRRAVLEITDALGAQITGYDLDKTIGMPITRDLFANAPMSTVGRILPIIAAGEWSDVGKVDAQGHQADKGLLPAIDVGDYLIAEDGTEAPTGTPFEYLHAPTNLTAEIVGTAGSRRHVYEVSALSVYGEIISGETTTAVIDVVGAPTILSATNFVRLSWSPVLGAFGYHVYRDGLRIDHIGHAHPWGESGPHEFEGDPPTEWTDTGALTPYPAYYPHTNTARIDQDINGAPFSAWGMLVLKHGAAAEVHHLYASDLATGAVPKRTRMPESVYGTEFLVPGRPGWPHATPYIERNGIRIGVIYARGPRLEHHRSGRVTVAWNGCADEDVGDGSGKTFTEAFPAWQHVINDHGLANGGVGYRTGTWPGLETFADGVPIIKTSAVQACQDLTIDWVGGRGYQVHIAIYTPITLRQFDREFRRTCRSETGNNHFGQLYPVLISDTADLAAGRLYHDRVNVAAMTSQEFRHQQVVTKAIFSFDPDPDANRLVQTDVLIEDTLATKAHGGRAREQGPVACLYSRDAATVWDAQARHIARYKVAPREVGARSDLGAVHDEIGTQVRATLHDGAGGPTGDVKTPFLVIGQAVDPSQPGAEACTLLLFDLQRISAAVFPLLGDKATAMNLFDKGSNAPPPDGAYVLM